MQSIALVPLLIPFFNWAAGFEANPRKTSTLSRTLRAPSCIPANRRAASSWLVEDQRLPLLYYPDRLPMIGWQRYRYQRVRATGDLCRHRSRNVNPVTNAYDNTAFDPVSTLLSTRAPNLLTATRSLHQRLHRRLRLRLRRRLRRRLQQHLRLQLRQRLRLQPTATFTPTPTATFTPTPTATFTPTAYGNVYAYAYGNVYAYAYAYPNTNTNALCSGRLLASVSLRKSGTRERISRSTSRRCCAPSD